MREKFICIQCGCCCRKIKEIVETAKELDLPDEVKVFPYKWNERGVCEMLEATDGKSACKVYENRPLICNVDKMHKYFDMPLNEFIRLNSEACSKLLSEELSIHNNLLLNFARELSDKIEDALLGSLKNNGVNILKPLTPVDREFIINNVIKRKESRDPFTEHYILLKEGIEIPLISVINPDQMKKRDRFQWIRNIINH